MVMVLPAVPVLAGSGPQGERGMKFITVWLVVAAFVGLSWFSEAGVTESAAAGKSCRLAPGAERSRRKSSDFRMQRHTIGRPGTNATIVRGTRFRRQRKAFSETCVLFATC